MPLHSRMRAFDRDLIRGGHYGQRSCEPHKQAEHMAAPTKPAHVKNSLANPGGRGRDGDCSPPPHRSRRALLTHRAPTLDGDEEPLLGPRMQDTWVWQVPVGDRLHSGPRQPTPLLGA